MGYMTIRRRTQEHKDGYCLCLYVGSDLEQLLPETFIFFNLPLLNMKFILSNQRMFSFKTVFILILK